MAHNVALHMKQVSYELAKLHWSSHYINVGAMHVTNGLAIYTI
jgi:hypothetical protein